jgi:uncharacterized protein
MRHSVVFSIAGALCLFASPAPAAMSSANLQIGEVVRGASEQTLYTRFYDPAYVKLAYPGGEPPLDRGVCSDVIVRAFRKAGVDLQREIHEDMARNFSAYPNRWHASRPDSNIDHRRVPNLMTYFTRMGRSLPVSPEAADYAPGDVVAWDLGGGVLHIGLVSDERAPGADRYEIVHNIGAGARREDVMFAWRIIGHYRYFRA